MIRIYYEYIRYVHARACTSSVISMNIDEHLFIIWILLSFYNNIGST